MAKQAATKAAGSNKRKRQLLAERRARKGGAALAPDARAKLEAAAREAQALAALAGSKKNVRRADVVARLAAGEPLDLPVHSHLVHVRALLKEARAAGPAVVDAAVRLLDVLRGAGEEWLTAREPARFAAALLGLARHHDRWLRAPEAWVRPSRNARRQLGSLARHLLATWPVPVFFDRAWLDGQAAQQGWWLHVASGQNLRTAPGLPVVLTKKAAHHALLAPDGVSVLEALRWGQVHGLGGDARVARGVLATRLGRTFEHDEFWETVVRWFVQHPLLDRGAFGPIVDYLREQRFVTVPGTAGPAQPGLSMRDREPAALVRQVEAWHRRLGRARPGAPGTWAGHPRLDDLVLRTEARDDAPPCTYVVVQLLSSADLVVEGRRLEHCVASYAWSCASGRVSIWSLRRVEQGGAWTPLLTLELDHATNTLVQACGKRNRPPTPAQWPLVERWLRATGVRASAWLRPA